jgi:hypothetical protein
MPAKRRPHYPLITLLARAAPPDRELTPSIVKDRVAYLVKKQVLLMTWPTN